MHSRRYTVGEIVAEHIPLTTLHELDRTGVVNVKRNSALGSELNDYLTKTTHHTPAIEILRQHAQQKTNIATGEKITRARVEQIGSKAKNTLPRYTEHFPFFYDIGVRAPFILVENEQISGFLGLYTQGVFSKTRDVDVQLDTHRALIDQVLGIIQEKERYVDFNTLCQVMGDKPPEVLKTVGYAQRRGKRLPHRVDGETLVYSLSHFKKVREAYLMEGEKWELEEN